MSKHGALLLLAAAQLACSTASNTELPAKRRAAVIGGMTSGDAENAVVLVRKLKPTGGYANCTGTLVAPNLVLTALHCVTPMNDTSNFDCTPGGNLVNSSNGDGELGAPLPPEYISVHVGPRPGATPTATAVRIYTTGSTHVCRGDLALVELDRLLEGPRLPIGLSSIVAAGHRVTVIGHGDSDPDAVGRQRRDNVRVTDVGVPPGGFVTDEGPCHGDSGGPAISSTTGAVVGVYSRIAGSCDSAVVQNTFTYLTAYQDFVLNAFRLAGAEPWLEGQPEPGTTGGAGGAAGASGAAGATAAGGSSGAGGSDPEPPRKSSDDDSGCSVSSPGSSRDATSLAALAALGVIAAARGRRRR